MKRYFLLLIFAVIFVAKSFAAPYDHIHLTAPDALEAVNWYVKHFGGEAGRFDRASDGAVYPIDRVFYEDIALIFFEREPTGGSVGTGVDHIGFSMGNVEEVVSDIIQDGGTQLGDFIEFSGMKIAFVEDPWGTKIELINDADLRGMHHLHLSSVDPERTLAWYAENFGGESDSFAGVLPGLDYGNIWLLVARADAAPTPTQGRSLDHLGWKYEDLTSAAETLKASGVEFTVEPRPFRGIRISFVEGPDGVRIELVEPAEI
ncbi:MAG: hypothetical protein CMP90_00210 [Gammaproteobacteria bacterium]|nr:hypothetical protein [Gammaproteobacteria bacterium]